MRSKILRIGHSPDADDAFMFYGIASGKVKLDGLKIQHEVKDIQSLNQMALKGELEVSAISAALYPRIAKNYWILSSGASVGRNYGPVVVSSFPISLEELSGKKIAVPGLHTTAFLLLKIFLKKFEPLIVPFEKILEKVKKKEVAAGLVIHEGQLSYPLLGLHLCADLGKLWRKKFGLPIPLGLDVVRKDLGLKRAKEINQLLYKSIRCAFKNQGEALAYASRFGRGMKGKILKKFVKRYVNQDTLCFNSELKRALKHLYGEGKELGFFKAVPPIEVIR